MRRYKLTLTRKAFTKRLAKYRPQQLRELMLILDKFEYEHRIIFEPPADEQAAVHKELLIAQYRELGATKWEIAGLLKRAEID